MSNRNNNDFDFDDDDLFGDRRTKDDDFDFGTDDDDDFPTDFDNTLDDDLTPEFDDEGTEERGPNRTFIFLALLMIVMFVVGLGAVLFLALRPTGPSDAELTGTQVVLLNQTAQAFLDQTNTQSAINAAATQTAAFEAVNLTQTALALDLTQVYEDSLLTQAAFAEGLANSLTETARAIPTNTRLPTNTPTPRGEPTATPGSINVLDAFSTQVAFVTQQAVFDQSVFATQIAIVTQQSAVGASEELQNELAQSIEATRSSLGGQLEAVQQAIQVVDSALATAAINDPVIAQELANFAPIGGATQTALAQVQQSLLTPLPTASPVAAARSYGDVDSSRISLISYPINARSVFDPQPQSQVEQIEPTAQFFSTQAAIATQSSLATRQALIERLLGTIPPTPTVFVTSPLEPINQTATAIAGAFLTATAQAGGIVPTQEIPLTPGGFVTVVPTALPDTGLFDDISGGGSEGIGLLALAVVGLMGVIFISRRLRTTNNKQPDPQQ